MLLLKIFDGSCLGVGCCFSVRCCSLKQWGVNARVTSLHQIHVTDHLNVVPFDVFDPTVSEAVSRGILLRYTPCKRELLVTLRFRLVNNEDTIRNIFSRRGICGDIFNPMQPDNDSYPFHYDTKVFGSKVRQINVVTNTVILHNNMIYSFDNVKHELD